MMGTSLGFHQTIGVRSTIRNRIKWAIGCRKLLFERIKFKMRSYLISGYGIQIRQEWCYIPQKEVGQDSLTELDRLCFFLLRNARRISVESLRFQPTTSRRRIRRTGHNSASFCLKIMGDMTIWETLDISSVVLLMRVCITHKNSYHFVSFHSTAGCPCITDVFYLDMIGWFCF